MKPGLILLHGALGSKVHFSGLIPHLTDQFEVFTLNFEGHGGNLSDSEFSIDLFSKNLVDFLVEHELKKVSVFGYSMGGYVALYTALRHPAYFQQIVTLGTKFDWSPASAEKEVKMLNPEVIEEKVPRFAENLKNLHAPDDWKKVMSKTATLMKNMGNQPPLTTADFVQIFTPVTIGIGEADKMVTQAESKLVADALPNSNYHILPNVIHPIDQVPVGILVEYLKNELIVKRS
jgi:pimeloyl-ACP methyl ester carboxylesterase